MAQTGSALRREDLNDLAGVKFPVEADHFIPGDGADGTYYIYDFNGRKVKQYLVAGQPYPGRAVWNIKDSSEATVAADKITVVF